MEYIGPTIDEEPFSFWLLMYFFFVNPSILFEKCGGRPLLLLLTKSEDRLSVLFWGSEPPPLWIIASRKAYRQFFSRKGRLLLVFIQFRIPLPLRGRSRYFIPLPPVSLLIHSWDKGESKGLLVRSYRSERIACREIRIVSLLSRYRS